MTRIETIWLLFLSGFSSAGINGDEFNLLFYGVE